MSPECWIGRQWSVTEFGVEARDGTYAIPAARLGEGIPGHCWPQHVSEKTWVDVDDFCSAWLIALVFHGVSIGAEDARDAVVKRRKRA